MNGGFSHEELDEHRLTLARAVVQRHTPKQIRGKILENLARWQRQGTWGPAYDEWRKIAQSEDDEVLLAVMLGRDENAVRLRQSGPYVGLLPQEEVRAINEETARAADRRRLE